MSESAREWLTLAREAGFDGMHENHPYGENFARLIALARNSVAQPPDAKPVALEEIILQIVRKELHQYYVSVPTQGCLFIQRGDRK
jgi:hypothetical protein